MEQNEEIHNICGLLSKISERIEKLKDDYTNSKIIGELKLISSDIRRTLETAEKDIPHHSIPKFEPFNNYLTVDFVQQGPIELAIFDKLGRYLFVTDKWLNNLNAKRSDVIGRVLYEVYPPSKERASLHQRALLGESISIFEKVFLLEKKEVIFNYSVGPLKDLNTEIIGFFVVGSDVTQGIKERDKNLIRLQERKKLEALGQLASGISHDLNNILTVISGNLELSRNYIIDPIVLNRIDKAVKACEQAGNLNHRLLSFGKGSIFKERIIELDIFLIELCEMLKRTIGENISVTEIFNLPNTFVSVDVGELESAIVNIATNARDAMPSGGRCAISTQRVTIEEIEANQHGVIAGDFALISIKDTGTGMSDEVRERAIEPFFTTKIINNGTGLGLSSVYGFLRQAGGFLEIQSTIGQGTVIKLYLPIFDHKTNNKEEPISESLFGNDEIILVVEDNPSVREVTVEQLNALGYTVIEASTVAEAVDLLQKKPNIKLIFSDIMLAGGLSGYELAEIIKKSHISQPILFTSGNPSYISQDTNNEYNYPILTKPFSLEELGKAVHSILHSKQ